MSRRSEFKQANTRTMRKLLLVAVAMFGFGYGLVPLYDVFCEIAGINGKTRRSDLATAQASKIDKDRWITVEFTGHASTGLPWEFRPMQVKMRVHPGEVVVANYLARNKAEVTMTGRAVPSVTPSRAASHFKKIECFCFSEQKLKAGEAKEMPVQFYVDTKIPEEVDTVTLSYAFFNLDRGRTHKAGKRIAENNPYPVLVHQTMSGSY